MARRTAKPFSITALAFAAALCPALAGAQSTFPAGGPGGVERRPSLLVSVAASPVGLDDWRRSDGPALVGSVQGRLNRFLVLEGEVTRWSAVDDFGGPGYFGGGESNYFFEHRASRSVDDWEQSAAPRWHIPSDRVCWRRVGRSLFARGPFVLVQVPSRA